MVNPQSVINGTYARLFINGLEVATLEAFKLELETENEEVNQPGELITGYKNVGLGGTGEFTIARRDHAMMKEWAELLKAGTPPEITMLGDLDDPSSPDALKVIVKYITLDNLTIMDASPKTVVKTTTKFKFGSYEFAA